MYWCRLPSSPLFPAIMIAVGVWSGSGFAAESVVGSFRSGDAYAACVLNAREKTTETGPSANDQAIAGCRGKADSYADDLFEAFDEYRRADFFGTKTRLISEIETRMAKRLAALFP